MMLLTNDDSPRGRLKNILMIIIFLIFFFSSGVRDNGLLMEQKIGVRQLELDADPELTTNEELTLITLFPIVQNSESSVVRKSFSVIPSGVVGELRPIEGSLETALARATFINNPGSKRLDLTIKGHDHHAIGFIEGFTLRSEILEYYTAIRLELLKRFGSEVFASVEQHVKKHEKYVLQLIHANTLDTDADREYRNALRDVVLQLQGIHQGINYDVTNSALTLDFSAIFLMNCLPEIYNIALHKILPQNRPDYKMDPVDTVLRDLFRNNKMSLTVHSLPPKIGDEPSIWIHHHWTPFGERRFRVLKVVQFDNPDGSHRSLNMVTPPGVIVPLQSVATIRGSGEIGVSIQQLIVSDMTLVDSMADPSPSEEHPMVPLMTFLRVAVAHWSAKTPDEWLSAMKRPLPGVKSYSAGTASIRFTITGFEEKAKWLILEELPTVTESADITDEVYAAEHLITTGKPKLTSTFRASGYSTGIEPRSDSLHLFREQVLAQYLGLQSRRGGIDMSLAVRRSIRVDLAETVLDMLKQQESVLVRVEDRVEFKPSDRDARKPRTGSTTEV